MLVVAVLLAGGALAWWLITRGGGPDEPPDAAEPAPVAQVQVMPMHRGEIERTLNAYGTAVAAPGGTRSFSFPFACRVVTVTTNIGQPVRTGDVLLQIEPSVDANLALATAQATQVSADAALKDAQARFSAHLATNTDLAAAQSAAQDANLRLESLQSRLPAASGDVRAPAAGLVIAIPAQPGAVIPADGPLVEIAVNNRLEARVGIAPTDAAEVRVGQLVRLSPVEGDPRAKKFPLTGTVRVVGRSVDPATRMVDGFIALDEPSVREAPILIGTYLHAEIVVEKKRALLAPRGAVLPDEQHPGQATLYTIQGGKALKHAVSTGIDDGKNVEINSGSETPPSGTNVVTQGAYELADGMAVEIAKRIGGEER